MIGVITNCITYIESYNIALFIEHYSQLKQLHG